MAEMKGKVYYFTAKMSVCVQLLLYKRVVVVDGVVFMHLDGSAQSLYYVSQRCHFPTSSLQ